MPSSSAIAGSSGYRSAAASKAHPMCISPIPPGPSGRHHPPTPSDHDHGSGPARWAPADGHPGGVSPRAPSGPDHRPAPASSTPASLRRPTTIACSVKRRSHPPPPSLPSPGMSALPLPPDPAGGMAERHRRLLLDHSDELLARVEELRLAGQYLLPPGLAEAIRKLQLRLDQTATRPRTLQAAHQTVFAVQQRLMAANPRHPQPRPHLGRAQGTARVARLPGDTTWKFLTLPAVLPGRSQAEWRELVEATVERALDRWVLAQTRAIAAARARRGARAALARARAAWSNYWDLRCEAEVLLGRPGPATLATPPRPLHPPAAAGAGTGPRPSQAVGPTAISAHPCPIESCRWDRTRRPSDRGWASPAGDRDRRPRRRCPSAELGGPGLPGPPLAGRLRPPGDPAGGASSPPRHPPGPRPGRDDDLRPHRPADAAPGGGGGAGIAPDRPAGGAPRPADRAAGDRPGLGPARGGPEPRGPVRDDPGHGSGGGGEPARVPHPGQGVVALPRGAGHGRVLQRPTLRRAGAGLDHRPMAGAAPARQLAADLRGLVGARLPGRAPHALLHPSRPSSSRGLPALVAGVPEPPALAGRVGHGARFRRLLRHQHLHPRLRARHRPGGAEGRGPDLAQRQPAPGLLPLPRHPRSAGRPPLALRLGRG